MTGLETMQFRTRKGDNTLQENTPENLLIRGGYITLEKYYTPLGMLLKKRMEGLLLEQLEPLFQNVGVPGHFTVGGAFQEISFLLREMVRSYRDFPCTVAVKKELYYGMRNQGGLWKRNVCDTLLLALAGSDVELQNVLEDMLRALDISFVVREGQIFFPHEDGEDDFDIEAKENPEEEQVDFLQLTKMEKVHTPGVKTVADVMAFFTCEKDTVLKTMLYHGEDEVVAVVLPGDREVDVGKVRRYLHGMEEQFRGMTTSELATVAGTVQGSVGPVGKRSWRILVDQSVVLKKLYVSGGNELDTHFMNVALGRDFAGERGDFAKAQQRAKGYHLGGWHTLSEQIRYRDASDAWAFQPVKMAYLNVDRLLLAMVHGMTAAARISLPKSLQPFHVVVTVMDPTREKVCAEMEELVAMLKEQGFFVLADGRKDRIGSKFKDYDLMAIEHRIILRKNPSTFVEVKHADGTRMEVAKGKLVEFLSRTV